MALRGIEFARPAEVGLKNPNLVVDQLATKYYGSLRPVGSGFREITPVLGRRMGYMERYFSKVDRNGQASVLHVARKLPKEPGGKEDVSFHSVSLPLDATVYPIVGHTGNGKARIFALYKHTTE